MQVKLNGMIYKLNYYFIFNSNTTVEFYYPRRTIRMCENDWKLDEMMIVDDDVLLMLVQDRWYKQTVSNTVITKLQRSGALL